MATDYSAGIDTLANGGTAVNLYAINKSGIELVQQYVLQQEDYTGNLCRALTLAINPAHDYVYVAYTGLSLPNIVGFKITSTGLEYQWEKVLQTGDAYLQGSTLTAGPTYVIEYTYPLYLWLHVLSQAGQELMTDIENEFDGTYVVTGSVDSTKTYYYSCRAASPSLSATSVAVFRFQNGVDVSTGTAKPVGTSTDPIFIQSVCM